MQNSPKVTYIKEISGKSVFTLHENEIMQFVFLLADGKSQEGTIEINLEGAGSFAEITGFVVGCADESIKITIVQNHLVQGTRSRACVRTVISGKSVFQYEGYIRIGKNAWKTDASLKNDNLLISRNARVRSRPYLEIKADNVRCTHGVSTGNISEDNLYYLTSRGLHRNTAKNIIIEGFLRENLAMVKPLKIRNIIDRELKNKLHLLSLEGG